MRPCCISPTSRTTRSTNITKPSASRWRSASRYGAIPTAVSDESRIVRARRRHPERGRYQIQRAARHVRAADAACRRQDLGQHRLRRGMVRQHRRARMAALSLLVSALLAAEHGGAPPARLHPPCLPRHGRARADAGLAFRGEGARATAVRDSLDPVRAALRRTRPAEKFHAHSKCWQELLGQTGGAVRRPLLELTQAERDATRRAFETCGL